MKDKPSSHASIGLPDYKHLQSHDDDPRWIAVLLFAVLCASIGALIMYVILR